MSVPCKESRPGLSAEYASGPTLKALMRPWETPAEPVFSYCIAPPLWWDRLLLHLFLLRPVWCQGRQEGDGFVTPDAKPWTHPLGTPCVGCYMDQETGTGQNGPSPSQTSSSQAHSDNCPMIWLPGNQVELKIRLAREWRGKPSSFLLLFSWGHFPPPWFWLQNPWFKNFCIYT